MAVSEEFQQLTNFTKYAEFQNPLNENLNGASALELQLTLSEYKVSDFFSMRMHLIHSFAEKYVINMQWDCSLGQNCN